MIIEMLLNMLYGIMDTLMVLNIPDMPAEVHSYIEMGFDYIVSGVGVLANYIPLSYVLTLFGVAVSIEGGILLYKFIMWILRKIPMLGIE